MSDEIRAEQLWEAARAMIKSGLAWKAKDILKTMIVAFPAHATARAEYASILQADGDLDNALIHSAFAYTLNPEIPGLARQLGELYLLAGIYRESLECLEKAALDGGKDPALTEKIALCREVLSQCDDSSETTH